MKNISCKGLAWYILILGIFVGPASRAYGQDTITGTAHVDTHGNFTGTGTSDPDPKHPQLDRDLQGTHDDHNVTATYSISTTQDAKGKIILDRKKTNTVTFNDTGFTTRPIPITGITVDNKGKVQGFDFKGTNWYDPNSPKADGVMATFIQGSIKF